MNRKKIRAKANCKPDMMTVASNLYTNQKYTRKLNNPIPNEFFENFKLYGKLHIPNVEKHLAMAAALFTVKEINVNYKRIISIDAIINNTQKTVAKALAEFKRKTKSLNPDYAMLISNQNIFEGNFDETANILRPLAQCYSDFSILADLWRIGDLNDMAFVAFFDKAVGRTVISTFKPDDFDLIYGPSQWAAFCVATDFLAQVAQADYECSEAAQKIIRTIKRHGFFDFGYRDICRRMGKKKTIEYLELMQSEPYIVKYHKDDDTLQRLRPYLWDKSQRLLDLAKEDEQFYEPALRQIYFGTQTMTTNAMNMFETSMWMELGYEDKAEADRRVNEEIAQKNKALSNSVIEKRELQSQIKKLRKEVSHLKESQVVGDSEEIISLKGKIESLDTEKKEALRKYDEARKELETIKTRDVRAKDKLADTIAKLDKERTRGNTLEGKLGEKDREIGELQTTVQELNSFVERLLSDKSSKSPFPEGDIEVAQKCKYVFFIPATGNSVIPILEKYFPKSKFIRSGEFDTFVIGTSTQAVIACTQGIAHGTYWRMEKQCKSLGIEYIPVNSCGLITLFNTAVKKYRDDNPMAGEGETK